MPAPVNPHRPYAAVHEHPNGSGDQRPTAMQILKDEGLLNDNLKGKTFMVTGCSAGLGIETARALHATGRIDTEVWEKCRRSADMFLNRCRCIHDCTTFEGSPRSENH